MASGDLEYEAVVIGTLSGSQRTSLGTLVGALWSGSLSDLQQVNFTRNADNSVTYTLFGRATASAANLPLNVKVTGRVP